MAESVWGERQQAGLPDGDRPFWSRAYPHMERAVVLKVYGRDSADSHSKSFVEVDLYLTELNLKLEHVPLMQAGYGQNGVEWTPQAPTSEIDLDAVGELKRALRETNADYVAVAFIGGHEPFVVGQLPRPRTGASSVDVTGYTATDGDGARVKGRVGGTTWEIDKNGNVVVTMAGGKEFKLVAASGNEIAVKTGDVNLSQGTLGVARLNDPVTATIPIGVVIVPLPVGGMGPNPVPIPLTGTITGASTRVKAG